MAKNDNTTVEIGWLDTYIYDLPNSTFMKSFKEHARWDDEKFCWVVSNSLIDEIRDVAKDYLNRKYSNKSDISIEIEDGEAYIYTPYNSNFVSRIKNLDAHWNRALKCWVVDENVVEKARKILYICYGYTDIMPLYTVDLLLTTPDQVVYEEYGPVVLFGKVVSGDDVDSDVCYLEGNEMTYYSENLHRHCAIEKNSKIKLLNVRRDIYEKELSSVEGRHIKVEVISEGTKDLVSLKREKENLLKRIEEIDKRLNAPAKTSGTTNHNI